MNSDDLIDQILSKGVDYDKSQVTVDSVLEDLIGTDSDISNLVNPIKEVDKDNKKEEIVSHNLEDFLKEEPEENNNKENKEEIKDVQSEEKKEEEKKEQKKEELKEIEKQIEKELEKEIERKKEEEKKRKEEEKKKEEERKKIETFIPQFPNPVDFVQYVEIVKVNTNISNENKNFILLNHRKKDNKYNISMVNYLKDINQKMSGEEINLMYAKKDALILCSNKGDIFMFSIRNQKVINKISPKNMYNKQINCLDITDDLQDIICGYQDGTICFINARTRETKYINNKIHPNDPCIEIRIFKKEKENEIYFFSSGGDGQVFFTSLKKMIFWKINVSLLIKSYCPTFMIKKISISWKHQYYVDALQLLNNYVIFGSLSDIRIFQIEPNIEQVIVIKKPDYIVDNVVPDVEIGLGRKPEIFTRFAKKDDKNHLIMIVSWGNIIYFYHLSIIDSKLVKEMKEVGYYINIFNILRIGFLNSSIVYCLDKSYGIKILDTVKINTGNVKIEEGKPVVPKNNELAEIEKSRHISEFISNQIKFVDSNEQAVETYLYSVLDNDLTVHILAGKEIYSYNLVNWDIFLNTKQKDNDFLNLFSVGIEIYNGRFSAFSNIPDNKILKRKVGDFLKEKIPEYINAIVKDKKSNIKDSKEKDKIYECICVVIEVCIELEAVEFLIRKIEPLFEEKEYGELFLARFEPFVLCDKIIKCVLSSDIILNLIDLYYKNNKSEILSQILLHINILALDKPEIKQKFEEVNLIIPLIYLYHNGKNEDYFSPLQKMFEYFISIKDWNKSLITDEDSNLIDYSNTISKKILTLKEIQKSKEYNGHRILWYIKWCLTGKKFPDNGAKMKDNLFDALVTQITYWLLREKVIDSLLSFDPKNYFIIFKNILSIKSLYNKLSLSFKNEKLKQIVLEEHSNEDIKLDDIDPSSLVDYLVKWCKKKNENNIYFYLYEFIIGISKNNDIIIKKELRIETAIYIMKNYKKTVKKINNQEVERFIIMLIDFIKDEMFKKEDYKQILSSIVDNLFDEVKMFLLEKIEEYRKCLELYLDKDSNIKKKGLEVYKWIDKTINKISKESNEYKELIEGIKDNIFSLISISMDEFYYLSRQIFKNIGKIITELLEKDKNIQLEYTELFIQSMIKKEFDLDDDPVEFKNMLILHINLLCELKKFDKIVPSLQSCPYYPLEESLSACEKAQAYEACLYLYIKEDSIDKAFDLCISKLDDTFNKIVENINKENKEDENQNLYNLINKYSLDARDICENNNKKNEDIWFKLLNILNKYEEESLNMIKKYENDYPKKKSSEQLHQVLMEEIKDLTEKMCSYVSIKRIIQVVTDKNKDSGFREYKDLIMKLLGIYSKSSEILFSVKNLLTSLILEDEKSFQEYNIKGKTINEQCDKCHKELMTDKIFIFNCKHMLHKECINIQYTEYGKEAICPICPATEIEKKNNNDEKSLVTQSLNLIDEKKVQSYMAIRIAQKLNNYDKKDLDKNELMIRNALTQ